MPVLFIACYPLFTHISIVLGLPLLQALAITCIALGVSYRALMRGSLIAWGVVLAIAAVSVGLVTWNASLFLLYVPPVAIPMMIFGVFASTLLPGKEPLVTAIGEESRGPLTPQMRRYTRAVTWLWAVILGAMMINNLLLPFWGSNVIWSWFTSVGNYLFIGTIFVGEFLLRRLLFPDHDHPGFIEYINIVVSANVSQRK